MHPDRWRQIEAIFHQAAELAASERSAFLDTACGSDQALRAEVDALLAHDGDTPLGDAHDVFARVESRPETRSGGDSVSTSDPLVGRMLGVYRLSERLGAGGMGVVYRGERADGLFQQDVAIKLIRAECATEWMVRRFERERRTLAGLEHPCIARLLDGGTSSDGCPYFVMELVRGNTIDQYARSLGLTARLRLFVQVCRAVQYAHQNLVVHCDLKPANILIDERGLPRLLDFGIARILDEEPSSHQPLAGSNLRTIARVLTPEYASPEQLAGEAVTTANDIYSLGVILYELLVGTRPLTSESRSAATWERLIRESTPERPSVRAGSRGRALRGDLDRMVMMAIRKEPDRRYASVQEFADDIERFLAGEPVRARPSSLGYILAKFLHRNKVPVAAAVMVLVALVLGLLAAIRSERIAEAEARHASMEADSFQSIATFLMDAFLPEQPAQDPVWLDRARTRILAQAERVRRQYVDNVHVGANLLDTLGHVAVRLELRSDAKALIDEAASLRRAAFGASSIEHALSLRSQGQLAYDSGQFEEAQAFLREALAIHRGAADNTHADVASIANDLAACLRNLGRNEEAEALHREALAARRATGPQSLPVAESLNNIAGVYMARGAFPEAVDALGEALSIRTSILGAEHPLSVQTVSNLGTVLWRAGRRDDAVATMARAVLGYRSLGADGEDGLSVALGNLSTMQMMSKDLDGAATSLDEALALQRKRLPAQHPLLATTLARLAQVQEQRGQRDRARNAWEEALAIRRQSAVPPKELAEALYGVASICTASGEYRTAIPLFREAIAAHQGVEDALARGRMHHGLVKCLLATDAPEEVLRDEVDEAITHLVNGKASDDEVAPLRALRERYGPRSR